MKGQRGSAGAGDRGAGGGGPRPLARPGVIAALLVALAGSPASADPAAEKWADGRLTITAGLAVWLDASRLNDARTAAGQPAVKDGDAIDLWPDAFGHGRHARQAKAAARPPTT